jgi:hypothetical protein
VATATDRLLIDFQIPNVPNVVPEYPSNVNCTCTRSPEYSSTRVQYRKSTHSSMSTRVLWLNLWSHHWYEVYSIYIKLHLTCSSFFEGTVNCWLDCWLDSTRLKKNMRPLVRLTEYGERITPTRLVLGNCQEGLEAGGHQNSCLSYDRVLLHCASLAIGKLVQY